MSAGLSHSFLGGEAFGDVRLFAAAFENVPICPFFKDSLESGSEQPHISESALRAQNYTALTQTCVATNSKDFAIQI
jgi:hypothetical protein